MHTARSYKVTTRLRGHDTKSTFWPTLCLLYTVILIQELRSRTRDANTWPSSVVSRVNTYLMQFLLSYETHVSSLSLLHFEDSIEAVDQISDKEPEGVQNSSGTACWVQPINNRYPKLAHGWLPYISPHHHHLLEPVLISLSIVSQCVPCRRELKFPCPTIIIISVI